MIVTAWDTKRPTSPKPGKPFGLAYELTKGTLDFYGYYKKYDLKRFDPEYYYDKYVKKYTYKPRKRITGHALSTKGFLRETPKYFVSSTSKFYEERRKRLYGSTSRNRITTDCKSCRLCDKCRNARRRTRLQYQSHMA